MIDKAELQIGDWLNLSDNDGEIIPCQVVELHTEGLMIKQPHETACDIVGYDMVCPILLTAEMLKSNGWEYYNSHTLKGGQTYELKVEKNSFEYLLTFKFSPYEYFKLESYDQGYYTLVSTKLVYKISVNRFQRLLRICGFSKLANAFKI